MTLPIALGIDDFRTLREQGRLYVDKSRLICDLLDRAGLEVLLLPRPRRFGKSLNLSMLRYYFERRAEDLSALFEDLAVWQAGDAYRAHFQRYPVLYLNFRDVKYERFEDAWWVLREKIRDLFMEHRVVLDSGDLNQLEADRYRAILDGSAPPLLYHRALQDLSAYLHRHHGERVMILIDEYDQPVHAAYVHGYTGPMLEFLRAFLTNGLKGNPHLGRAVLTGILRIARESIFSGLNNLAVHSLLKRDFATAFGFTEEEVRGLLGDAGKDELLPVVQRWYDGYRFGGEVMYNPWSVLSYLYHGGDPEPYWLNTSSNDLIKELLGRHASRLQPALEGLLAGDGVERVVDENVVLEELEHDQDALWSLLLFSGYLKAEKCGVTHLGRAIQRLTIPNHEVRLVYIESFRGWMRARLGGHGGSQEALVEALLAGDAAGVERELTALALDLLSYHDGGSRRPESLYQGFILGLLAVMEESHQVRSNRESGAGRPDVLIRPRRPGEAGVVLELKVARAGEKSLEAALEEGLSQLVANDYAAELRAAGAAPVHALAVAFDGKRVRVRRAGEPRSPDDGA